ncbi:hypothetical protein V6Z11_1Z082600 [Gossypium hirsutum]
MAYHHLHPVLGDLPESCVASIIQHLDPPEICKLAKLNRAFSAASWADFVWESKLPPNYHILLCRPNTFDGGTKKVWLHKSTGGVCMSISSKGLQITGIDDRRYWNHIPTNESRFHSIAYLRQIWWFEVNGEVEFPFPVGTYSVFFRLQLGRAWGFGRGICDPEQVHGWDIKPVRFQLWTSGDKHSTWECSLSEAGKCSSTKIKLSMSQIDCTHTKGGLCLDSVCHMSKCI